MSLIQHNLNTSFALRQLNTHNAYLSQALERLSSGYRIVRSADDPAGLAFADRLRAQVRGLQQASRNIGLATNFIRSAEDGMSEIINVLFDIRDLALEASNGTQSTSDRLANQSEISQLLTEIDRLATAVRFNGLKLLNGAYGSKGPLTTKSILSRGSYIGSAIFHVGSYKDQTIKTYISTQSAEALGINSLSVTTQLLASNSVLLANSAISRLLSRRARLGGVERRLQHAKSITDIQASNNLSAESAIRDADTAAEITNFTRRQILIQTATAMLAQANLLPQTLVALLFNFR